MSVNQATEAAAAAATPPAPAGNDAAAGGKAGAKAGKEDARTDMVGKALGLLVLLGDEPRGASAAELSRRAELPFSTTYRLLGSLTRDGFVDYEPDGRRYHLGLRIFQLGQRVSNHHGFAGTALPILRRVTEETGEATILSVRDGNHHLTVNKVDGPQTFRVTSDPGHLGALHTTSVGKALVAFADDATRSQLVEELELEPLTEFSITGPGGLPGRDRAGAQARLRPHGRGKRAGHARCRRPGLQLPGPRLRLAGHGGPGLPDECGGPRGPGSAAPVGGGRAVRPAAPAMIPAAWPAEIVPDCSLVEQQCNM